GARTARRAYSQHWRAISAGVQKRKVRVVNRTWDDVRTQSMRKSAANVVPSRWSDVAMAFATVFLCCCASLSGCHGEAPAPAGPPEVLTATVVTKRITEWDEYTGRFEAVDSVEVRPRASGYIDEVKFREGQIVAKDQVLVVIDPRPYQADLDR